MTINGFCGLIKAENACSWWSGRNRWLLGFLGAPDTGFHMDCVGVPEGILVKPELQGGGRRDWGSRMRKGW